MYLDPVTNFAIVSVSGGYSSTATVVSLDTGEASKLPDPSISGAYNVVWYNSSDYANPVDDPSKEIVRIPSLTSDTLTVQRAQESTSATDKNLSTKNYKMILALTAKTIFDINNTFVPNTTTINGLSLTGNISLTGTSETLANKIIDESNRAIGSPINSITSTLYTFVLTDAGKLVTFNSASSMTATITSNASVSFVVGTQIDCSQLGAGKVTFAQGSGVTINSESSNKSIGAQYAGVTLRKLATDTWLLVGNLIT